MNVLAAAESGKPLFPDREYDYERHRYRVTGYQTSEAYVLRPSFPTPPMGFKWEREDKVAQRGKDNFDENLPAELPKTERNDMVPGDVMEVTATQPDALDGTNAEVAGAMVSKAFDKVVNTCKRPFSCPRTCRLLQVLISDNVG